MNLAALHEHPWRRQRVALGFLLVEGLLSLAMAALIYALEVRSYQLSASYAAFATLALLAALPAVLVSPLIGPLLDRLPRGWLVGFCDGLSLLLMVAGLVQLQQQGFSLMLAALLVLGLAVVQTIRWPTLVAAVSTLSAPEDAGRISAYEEAIESAVAIAAPLLAIPLIEQLGLPSLLLTLGLAALLSLAGLHWVGLPVRLRRQELRAQLGAYAANFLGELRFGFGWIAQQVLLRRLLVFLALLNVAANVFVAMQTPLALRLGSTSEAAGVMASGGVGLGLGGALVALLGGRSAPIATLYAATSLVGLALAVYGTAASIAQLSLGAALFGLALPLANATMQQLWRERAPLAHQGAIFAVRRMLGAALAPLAIIGSVPLAERWVGPSLSAWPALSQHWPDGAAAALGGSLLLLGGLALLLVGACAASRWLRLEA